MKIQKQILVTLFIIAFLLLVCGFLLEFEVDLLLFGKRLNFINGHADFFENICLGTSLSAAVTYISLLIPFENRKRSIYQKLDEEIAIIYAKKHLLTRIHFFQDLYGFKYKDFVELTKAIKNFYKINKELGYWTRRYNRIPYLIEGIYNEIANINIEKKFKKLKDKYEVQSRRYAKEILKEVSFEGMITQETLDVITDITQKEIEDQKKTGPLIELKEMKFLKKIKYYEDNRELIDVHLVRYCNRYISKYRKLRVIKIRENIRKGKVNYCTIKKVLEELFRAEGKRILNNVYYLFLYFAMFKRNIVKVQTTVYSAIKEMRVKGYILGELCGEKEIEILEIDNVNYKYIFKTRYKRDICEVLQNYWISWDFKKNKKEKRNQGEKYFYLAHVEKKQYFYIAFTDVESVYNDRWGF